MSRDPNERRPEGHLHHPHLMSSNIERTVAFWTDCFGASVAADETMAGSRNVFLNVGRGRLNLYDHAPNHRGPVNHLGVHVADLEATVARLDEAGWEPRPIKVDGPLSYSMVEGPDGLLLEVFHFDSETTPERLRPYFDLPPRGQNTPAVGSGSGTLSPEAEARLSKPATEPLRPPPVEDLTAVQQWRDVIHAAWLDGDPPAADCGHSEVAVGGVRCLVTGELPREPAAAPQRPTILYFHGGGYCLGSPEVSLSITERLAGFGNVISVDYRLAPEHPFPAAIEDGQAVLDGLQPPWPVVLAGDSAGANIALSIALNNPGRVAALALFSPHLEFDSQGARSADDPRSDVDDQAAQWLRTAYLGDRPGTDPALTPALTDLSALPPTLIQVGSIDSTLTGACRFARRARMAGVEIELDIWDGLWHAWHYHRDLPEADRALSEAGTFLVRSH